MTNPPTPEPSPTATPQNPVSPGPGVPDIRLSEKMITTRERELLVILKDRETKPDKVIEAYIELGLLQLRERRLPEAKQTFEKLAAEQLNGPQSLQTLNAERAGKIGQAVVLAHLDQAGESMKLFEQVFRTPPKLPVKGEKDGVRTVRPLLLQHPDLAQAVAEALNRNAMNLGVTKLAPGLESFRTTDGVSKKE
jgi:serine/threonine-protein kinase